MNRKEPTVKIGLILDNVLWFSRAGSVLKAKIRDLIYLT